VSRPREDHDCYRLITSMRPAGCLDKLQGGNCRDLVLTDLI
jgi:hypothetical protein